MEFYTQIYGHIQCIEYHDYEQFVNVSMWIAASVIYIFEHCHENWMSVRVLIAIVLLFYCSFVVLFGRFAMSFESPVLCDSRTQTIAIHFLFPKTERTNKHSLSTTPTQSTHATHRFECTHGHEFEVEIISLPQFAQWEFWVFRNVENTIINWCHKLKCARARVCVCVSVCAKINKYLLGLIYTETSIHRRIYREYFSAYSTIK